jgi:cystathionine beta-lyase
MEKRHNWEIEKESLVFTPGVVPALSLAISAFTNPGDKIIVQPPVYYPFFDVIRYNGRTIVYNELKEVDGRYVMDLEDFKNQIDERVKMFILCSPHNPVGRVWTETELRSVAEICLENDILIISDEIHCDLAFSDYTHIPLASLSDDIAQKTLTFTAPSKTFNIAGLALSFGVISNEKLLEEYKIMVERMELKISNIFGIVACEAAYKYGEEWLDQLMEYLEANANYLMEFCKERIPQIRPISPEGTYLMWLDCKKMGLDDNDLKRFMIETARVGLNHGPDFGPGGSGFQRINIACPRATLKEGLERIAAAVNT